jgi:hypothetical protein
MTSDRRSTSNDPRDTLTTSAITCCHGLKLPDAAADRELLDPINAILLRILTEHLKP